jgi:hypothetical protein
MSRFDTTECHDISSTRIDLFPEYGHFQRANSAAF